MAIYVAIASSRGPIRTGAAHGFTFRAADRQVDVVARTLIRYHPEGWDYEGLRLTMKFEANSREEALAASHAAADEALGLLSLAAAAETPPLQLELLYSDPQEGEEGELIRFALQDLSEVKMHKAYASHLRALGPPLRALPVRSQERVARALRWYRRGLREADPLDRYAAFWIALETLNPLLERKWGFESVMSSCPNCGHELGRRSGVYGAEKLLREIPEGGESTDRHAKQLRNGILHSFQGLGDSTAKAMALMSAAEVVVPRAIARLLGLSEADETSLARRPVPPGSRVQSYVSIPFRRRSQGQLGPEGFQPHAEYAVREHVRYNTFGEPEQVAYEGEVRLFVSDAFEPISERIVAVVIGRDGALYAVQSLRVELGLPVPTVPEQQGKGVSLWQNSDEPVWSY